MLHYLTLQPCAQAQIDSGVALLAVNPAKLPWAERAFSACIEFISVLRFRIILWPFSGLFLDMANAS